MRILIVSNQTDRAFWRTLTLVMSGLFVLFIGMIVVARSIVY